MRLQFEQNLLKQIDKAHNWFWVLARGLGIHRIVAHFLADLTERLRLNPEGNKPYLVFLLHFQDEELLDIAWEYEYLNIKKVQEGQNKLRGSQYLKGGIFAVTPKMLILDLLSKKIPACIITGIIMTQAQKVIPMSPENFLMKIYRKENSTGFIKWFSDLPINIGSTYGKMEELMKINFVDSLVVCPRNRSDVISSLENSETFNVYEWEVFMDNSTATIHNYLIRLLKNWLDELITQTSTYDVEPELFSLSEALEPMYEITIHKVMGNKINKIGNKARQLIKDIISIKQLLFKLLTGCWVSFLSLLLEIRQSFADFTIFRFSDTETLQIIEKMEALAKERVFKINPVNISNDEIMDCLSDNSDMDSDIQSICPSIQEDPATLAKLNLNKTPPKLNSNEYLVERQKSNKKDWSMNTIATMDNKTRGYWENMKRQCLKVNYYLKASETEFSLNLVGDATPKWDALISVLKKINAEVEAQASSNFIPEKEQNGGENKRRIMIVVKSEKFKKDIERYIASYFMKKDKGKSVIELNLKNMLNKEKEIEHRHEELKKPGGSKEKKIELFFLEKLFILLTQKYNAYFTFIREKYCRWKINRQKEINKVVQGMKEDEANAVLTEFKQICESNDNTTYFSEAAMTEVDPQSFRYDRIFPGWIVEVAYNFRNTEFDVFARHFKPNDIILVDPAIEFLRSIETYNARRNKDDKKENVNLHLMYIKDSY